MSTRNIARLCLGLCLAIGLFGLFQPQYIPKAPSPYDKIVHLSVFALVTSLAVISFEKLIISALIAMLIFFGGVAIEMIQAFDPNRQAELLDIVTNFIGVICAFFLTLTFQNKNRADKQGVGVRDEILEFYQEEERQGTPVQVRLEKAAHLYSRSFPDLPPAQVRLIVSEIFEKVN